MERKKTTQTTMINDLLESWRLAEAYEKDDLDQWASDVRLSVQQDLLKLSDSDRDLFLKEVNSTK